MHGRPAPPLAAAAPLAALTSFKADSLSIPAGAAPGALCVTLPCLQQPDVGCSCVAAAFVGVLQGHLTGLSRLRLQHGGPIDGPCRQPQPL
jgi:hypothetical protein